MCGGLSSGPLAFGRSRRHRGSRSVEVGRVEQLHFLEIHLRLHLTQHDVIDQILVAQRGDGLPLIIQNAEPDPPDQIAVCRQIAGRGVGAVRPDELGAFFIIALQAFHNLGAGPERVGDLRQGFQGGLGAASSGQLQLVGTSDVVRHSGPADHRGQ